MTFQKFELPSAGPVLGQDRLARQIMHKTRAGHNGGATSSWSTRDFPVDRPVCHCSLSSVLCGFHCSSAAADSGTPANRSRMIAPDESVTAHGTHRRWAPLAFPPSHEPDAGPGCVSQGSRHGVRYVAGQISHRSDVLRALVGGKTVYVHPQPAGGESIQFLPQQGGD